MSHGTRADEHAETLRARAAPVVTTTHEHGHDTRDPRRRPGSVGCMTQSPEAALNADQTSLMNAVNAWIDEDPDAATP